jgi:two-component system response regulator GlrR
MPKPRGRILCVDDDPAMQELLVWQLQSAGFRPLAVSSGRDALRLAEAEPIDLFVLDYQMPDMNGEELAAELRRRCPGVLLLMVSGSSAIPDAVRQLVDGFVPKDAEFNGNLVSEATNLLASSRRAA